MSSLAGLLIPVAFLVGIVLTVIRRLRYSDYTFVSGKDDADVVSPGLMCGFAAGVLLALWYVFLAVEAGDYKKINWFLVVGGFALLGGGASGFIILIVSALPAKLWRVIFRKNSP